MLNNCTNLKRKFLKIWVLHWFYILLKLHKSYIFLSSFLYCHHVFFWFCLLFIIIGLQTPCFIHQILYHILAQNEKILNDNLNCLKILILKESLKWDKWKLPGPWLQIKRKHKINELMLTIYKWKFVEKDLTFTRLWNSFLD